MQAAFPDSKIPMTITPSENRDFPVKGGFQFLACYAATTLTLRLHLNVTTWIRFFP